MPILSLLLRISTFLATSIFGKILATLGIGLISYNVADLLVKETLTLVSSLWGGLPLEIISIMSILKIPQALSIIMSAYAISAAIQASKLAFAKQ